MDPVITTLQAHETRLQQLEARMNTMQVDMIEVKRDLKSNTEMTAKIDKNTEDLVNMFKGGKTFGNFAKWFAGVLAGLGAIYLFFKEVVHHLK